MIQVNLKGGLGNQLFQICTLYGFTRRHNLKMWLNASDMLYDGRARPTYWKTLLKELRPNLTNVNLNSLPAAAMTLRYTEPFFDYREIPAEIVSKPILGDRSLLLDGYFQSYKYFDAYREEILDLIGIRAQRAPFEKETGMVVGAKVAMHFRRGDYLLNTEYHPVLDETYYRFCLSAVENTLMGRIGDNTMSLMPTVVYCFCEDDDDSEVARMLTVLSAEFASMEFRRVSSKTWEDWQQLLWMSACDHHIIANSSFSWFGAFFSEDYRRPNQLVCYPQPWFGPKFRSGTTADLCPPEWHAIST